MRSVGVFHRLFQQVAAGTLAIGLLAAGWAVPLSAQTVLKPTQTHLAATVIGAGASFEVKVAATSAEVPTGTVSLWSGETPIAAAVLDADGVATYTASALPPGTRQVTASYSGDAQYAASTSSLTAVSAAAAAVPGFSLTANPPTLTVKAGNYGTAVVSVVPVNGFDQSVSLSCSGLPLSSTCTFSPVNVLPGANGATVISTLNIQTQAASGMLREDSRNQPAYAWIVPGAAVLAALGLRRRKIPAALRVSGAVLLLAGCTLGLGACAARYNYFHKPPSGNPGTTLGTSTIVISGSGVASSGSLVTATTQITLTVN